MTAQDFVAEQAYHKKKLEQHNRLLHKPGVDGSVGKGLHVKAAGGLQVEVMPGAVVTCSGDLVHLSEQRTLDIGYEPDLRPDDGYKCVYITIQNCDSPTDFVENFEQPQYSGHTRIAEQPQVKATLKPPDGQKEMELARVELGPYAKEIREPEKSDDPKANEIDRRHVVWGPLGMSAEKGQHLIQVMDDTRSNFAALNARFPTPSVKEAGRAAMMVEMLALTDCVHAEHLPRLMALVEVIERAAGQELKAKYGNDLDTRAEFRGYVTAVETLRKALGEGETRILNAQNAVATAAGKLKGC
jgi:hypothetical protein